VPKLILAFGRVFGLRLSPEVSDILDLLHKGVIYIVGGPSIQTYMTKYIQEMIYLMYGAECRVPMVRI
jgi:hypothetical protein